MTSFTVPGLRWWMIGLVMLGGIINYLTRSTLAVAAPTMLGELHISAREYSWIVGTFQIAIMLQPICGYVLDVLGLQPRAGDLRHRVVVDQHGARPRPQLADARGAARSSWLRRRIRQSRRHEGDRRVVPRARAGPRGRCLQHRRLARIDARPAARRLGDPDLQLADVVRHHRQLRPRVGRALARVLRVAGTPSRALRRRARLHRRRTGGAPARRRSPAVDRADSACSATSGESRCRASSPTRPGARSRSGCRSISARSVTST